MRTASLQNRRILLVEDEYMIADQMQRALEEEGAVVLGPAPFVHEALRLIEENRRIDSAILDINLGGEQVFPVATALEARGILFLFTTGYAAADLPIAWHHIPRLQKPVLMAQVVRALLASGAF